MGPFSSSNLTRFTPGLRRTFFGLFTGWTLLGFSVLGVSQYFARNEEQHIALDRAKDSYHKDLAYRRWASERGGIYVPADAHTPPNPYLAHLPERDVTTTDGKSLTLVNPAYMNRLVQELGAADYGLQGHITSLRPIRPGNAPDSWERKALESFESGAREYSEVVPSPKGPVLRYMGAFVVEESCLKCHGNQGYRTGDIRGGISVTVPIKSSATMAGMTHMEVAALAILGLWLLGVLALLIWRAKARQATREHDDMVAELERNARQFQALQSTTPDGLWFLSPEGQILSVNETYCRLVGYRRDELVGKPVSFVEALESQEDTQAHIDRLITRNEGERFQTQHVAKDRHRVHLEVTTTPLVEDGLVLAFLRDVTRELGTLQSLQESESRFRQLFEASPMPMLIHQNGRLVMANAAAATLLDAPSPEALIGSPFLDRIHPECRPLVEARTLQAMARKSPVGLVEECLITVQGREVWTEVQTTAIDFLGHGSILVLCRDLTERRAAEQERRQLETEIQHAQKLESLGSLAGGIAHDMNNVLAAILGVAELLQTSSHTDPEVDRSLQTIERAAHRGRDLVKGLMDFARKGLEEPKQLDLNRLVADEVDLLRRTTRQRFAIHVDLEPNLPPLLGDASALGSAFMNICVNAFDAMPSGGTLTVSTRRADNRIRLQVRDTGEGIPPDVLQRVTEPFFTTKPLGCGTGLGLAQVYGTVKAHGGTLDIQSQVGVGTCVTWTLPIAGAAETSPRLSPPVNRDAPAPLRVLVVDDDELIRIALPQMLEQLGHQVEAAPGGMEALRRLEAGLSADLVILDHNMPGMSGSETLPRLQRLCPGMMVILSTGFLDNDLKLVLANFPEVVPLQKPFSIQELDQAIAMVMQNHPPRTP